MYTASTTIARLRKCQHVVVADAEPLAIRGRRFHVAGGCMPLGIDHRLLLAQSARQHGAESAIERRLVHVELVGIHGPKDQGFYAIDSHARAGTVAENGPLNWEPD